VGTRGNIPAPAEDVLDLYAEEPDPKRPVICFDESPTQLIGEVAVSAYVEVDDDSEPLIRATSVRRYCEPSRFDTMRLEAHSAVCRRQHDAAAT
jgi:hypothetical protein